LSEKNRGQEDIYLLSKLPGHYFSKNGCVFSTEIFFIESITKNIFFGGNLGWI